MYFSCLKQLINKQSDVFVGSPISPGPTSGATCPEIPLVACLYHSCVMDSSHLPHVCLLFYTLRGSKTPYPLSFFKQDVKLSIQCTVDWHSNGSFILHGVGTGIGNGTGTKMRQ